MNRPTGRAGALALALSCGALLAAHLGGCSSTPEERRAESDAGARDAMSELRAYVRANIADAAAATSAAAAVDELEKSLDTTLADTDASVAEMRKTNARYETTGAELRAVMERFEAKRRTTRAAAVAAHLKLRAATPEAHWAKVFELESKAVQSKVAIAPADAPAATTSKGG